ncbi:MAG TPA: hypothetical protein PLV51_12750 [Lentimicrobium sp.]|jgi:hypothetical protein|nr:hypothetical protein [Lentimicrobium sp.]
MIGKNDGCKAGLQAMATDLMLALGESEHIPRGVHNSGIVTEVRHFLEQQDSGNRWFVSCDNRLALGMFASLIMEFNPEKLPWIRPAGSRVLAFRLRPLMPFEGVEGIIAAMCAGYRCVINITEENRKQAGLIARLVNAYLKDTEQLLSFTTGPLPRFDAIVNYGSPLSEAGIGYLSGYRLLDLSDPGYRTIALSGKETGPDLSRVADLVCSFFGRTSWNLRSILVPEGYHFDPLIEEMKKYRWQMYHAGYFNHYDYGKAALLTGGHEHIDTGHLLLTAKEFFRGRIAVLHYGFYKPDEINSPDFKLSGPDTDGRWRQNPFEGMLKKRLETLCKFLFQQIEGCE